MGALKTFLVATLAVTATSAAALPHSPAERARTFADCAGRLAALEEHQRLFDGPASERTAGLRATFLDLLDAVTPDAVAYGLPPEDTLNRRVAARADHRGLLSRASFATDPLARAPAAEAASRHIAACTRLIPGA